jgi:predicted component of type VI protein secretion system
MTDHAMSSAEATVALHLLDPAMGHALQSWRFAEKPEISIGRADDNDVVIADPHVSRIHAKIVWNDERWTLVSIGRHGTIVDDRIVAETQLFHQMRFRLGSRGPTLRFESGVSERRPSETIDSVHPDLNELLEIDRLRQQAEANAIAGNPLFRELQDRVRRTRRGSAGDGKNVDQAIEPGGN